MNNNQNTPRTKWWVKMLIVFGVIIVIFAAIFAFVWFKFISPRLPFYYDENGIKQTDRKITITIEMQHFESEVASMLYANGDGVIISEQRFLDYLHENYPDFVCLNGVYTLSDDMSYDELIAKLQNPDMRIEYLKVTVPEGKNIRGIAKIMEGAGVCSYDEFIAAADSYDYEFKMKAELEARDQSLIGYKLEGFLFPATYTFRKDTVTAKEVVQQMLVAFENYVSDSVVAKAAEKGLTVNQLVSFASVIQAEAYTTESMEYISSIFWNRYNSNYKRFESDPTTTYAKSLSELAHYTPAMKAAYNTYECSGMPIGPINCPGMATINAVLNPADTNYFYFITDSDNNFYYNETYKEHVEDCYATGLWKR